MEAVANSTETRERGINSAGSPVMSKADFLHTTMVQVQHLELIFGAIAQVVPDQDPTVTYLADHGKQYASDIAERMDRFSIELSQEERA